MRRRWLAALWLVLTWLAAWRRSRATPRAVRARDFRTQTRGMGLAMTDSLRDRFRPRWLRLRRPEDA